MAVLLTFRGIPAGRRVAVYKGGRFMEKRLYLLLLLISPVLFFSCSRKVTNMGRSGNTVIFPPPPDTTRIQYLTSISSSLDITGHRKGFARFVLGDKQPVPVVKPYGIALQGGRIFVCDAGFNGLEVIDLQKKTFEYFIPKGKGQLKIPSNCFVDADGTLFVSDIGRKQVVVFDQQGQYLDAFGEAGESKPTDVAVAEDKIWVPDAMRHCVHVYQKTTRKFLFSFPDTLDKENGYLFQPTNICVSGDRVYVTDFGDFRVKTYNLKGEYISSVGSYGNAFGQFVRPKGISADREANLFVVDAGFENVQIFNKLGQLLMFFGGPYKGPGDMWLPAKVFVDYDNLAYFGKYVDPEFRLKYLVFVTNQYGPDKISVYGAVEPAQKQP